MLREMLEEAPLAQLGHSASASKRRERRHENVTSNRTRSCRTDDRHRNRVADFEHRQCGRGRTRQVVRGGRLSTADSPTGASCASWVVSDRHISRSLKSEAGWQSCGGSRCCDR